MEKFIIELIVGIILLLLSIFSRKYLEPKMPDKKKAISYIKKFFLFTFRIIFPIIMIVFEYNFFTFNAFFVIVTCFYFSLIILNILLYVMSFIETDLNGIEKNISILDKRTLYIIKILKELDKKN